MKRKVCFAKKTTKDGKTKVSYTIKSEPIQPGAKQGRNELCKCGSGKKFKHCCLLKGLNHEEKQVQEESTSQAFN